MQRSREHRQALRAGRYLGLRAGWRPDDHRVALTQLRAERQQLQAALKGHRQTLERVRDHLARQRNYHRVVYEQNRWWIELALRWWEGRRAARARLPRTA